MIIKGLLSEFSHETENTRKLLNAIPDSALGYKITEKGWTIAQLASHIAEIYNWYEGTFEQTVFDMATYKYDKGDVSKASNIVAKFEENAKKAQATLEKFQDAPDSMMFENWSLAMGDQVFIAPMARVAAVRGFLCSHLYHHRGEMIVYLRASGNKVPGLYGPTLEESSF